MHTRRTIALIGTGTLARALAEALLKGNNRILLFSRSHEDAEMVTASIKNKNTLADIEAMPCSYNASWEADIIITGIPSLELKEFVLYIKEVAVQKTFVVGEMIDKCNNTFWNDVAEIPEALPFTKIITVSFNICKDDSIEYSIKGNNREAAETIDDLFEDAGMLSIAKNLLN